MPLSAVPAPSMAKKSVRQSTSRTTVRQVNRRWLRGPARLEGDTIVVDYARGTAWDPLSEPALGRELARVRTPDDAVAFAERFGLLRDGAEGIDRFPEALLPGREPFQVFAEAAESLRSITRTVLDVRSAVEGDAEALLRLAARFFTSEAEPEPHPGIPDWDPPPQRIRATDDRSLLIHASHWSGWQLSIALKDTRAFIYDRAERGESVSPGHLRVGILPRTLLDACYLTLAVSLADKDPLSICMECERLFVVEDARQKFCTPKCANRSRFRKHDQKRKAEANVKTTRTRRR